MIKKLRKWRKARNIKEPNYKVYFENIIEELLEPMYKKEEIAIIQKDITEKYFKNVPLTNNKIIDTVNDITVFSVNECEMMKYNFKKTMNETIKEINSRKQNPNQKEVWGKWGAVGKWEKDKSQDINTLYEANYDGCRLN